jgi:hypothetical protein
MFPLNVGAALGTSYEAAATAAPTPRVLGTRANFEDLSASHDDVSRSCACPCRRSFAPSRRTRGRTCQTQTRKHQTTSFRTPCPPGCRFYTPEKGRGTPNVAQVGVRWLTGGVWWVEVAVNESTDDTAE